MPYSSNLSASYDQQSRPWPKALDPSRQAREIQLWLLRWEFTHFVTLTFSDPEAGLSTVRGSNLPGLYLEERLKKWDALVNSKLLGRNWQARTADRIFWVATLEKPKHSPHYHLLMKFPQNDRHDMATGHKLFDAYAEPIWRKLVPAGTADVKRINSQRQLAKYILKSFHIDVDFNLLILPDEFSRWSTPGIASAIARHAR